MRRPIQTSLGMFVVLTLAVVPLVRAQGRDSFGPGLLPSGTDQRQQGAQHSEEIQAISLALKDSTIEYAITLIARQAGLRIVYNNHLPALSRRVSVDVSEVSLADALKLVLKGTNLEAQRARDGQTLVVRALADSVTGAQAPKARGIVRGMVRDSATGMAVKGVAILIQSTNSRTVTEENGSFVLRDVPPGEYVIAAKLFGYQSTSQTVVVHDGKTAMVDFVLRAVPTQLSGVVTTATGQQRRVEVGNDITVIDVDSVVQTMPVTSVSDLLATRVPGLYATSTSGEPGAPKRLRIRGLGSVNADNDPIVIVDGIRVHNEQRRMDNARSGLLQPSALDQIDVNSIGTIEVLKGPSAVAMYGSDAANGVIVITTKRGREGPPQWSLSSNFGLTEMPGKWPTNYYRWGHSLNGLGTLTQCTLIGEVLRQCAPDSLVTYQILNDRETTIFGTGQVQSYSGTVSGGTRGFTYSLSGSMQKEIGIVKMADADRRFLEANNELVPFWQRKPQQKHSKSGTLALTLDLGPRHDFLFTTKISQSEVMGTPLRGAIELSTSLGPSTGSDVTGILTGISNFRQRESALTLQNTNAAKITSNFGHRINTEAMFGIDITSPTTRSYLANGDCFVVTSSCTDGGELNFTQGSITTTTMNLKASKRSDFKGLLSLTNTIALNYVRTIDAISNAHTEGLPPGATAASEAALVQEVRESRSDRITAGAYIETLLGIANRVYLPFAIRKDAGSALGANSASRFPKTTVSYLLSDEPWFHSVPLFRNVSTFRIRASYGEAGRQPSVSDRIRTYIRRATVWDDANLSYLALSSVGNTALKPERSKEFESGFDTDFWNDRIALTMTWYRKYTTDLLVSDVMPPSVNGGSTQWFNIGDVHNTGFETTLGATLFESRHVNYRTNIIMSRNRNVLVRIGGDFARASTTTEARYKVGYPLNSYWTRNMVGYSDFNEDGIIGADEVLMADSAVYAGTRDPRMTMSWNNSFMLFGRLSFNTMLRYDHKFTQWNQLFGESRNSRTSWKIKAANDPSVPLAAQAYALWSDIPKLQAVSLLRFDEMSLRYILPKSVTTRWLPGRSLSVSLQGRNLGTWTDYRGKDPDVNSDMSSGRGEAGFDRGALPQSRLWQISLMIN